jgi:hypothetical protein
MPKKSSEIINALQLEIAQTKDQMLAYFLNIIEDCAGKKFFRKNRGNLQFQYGINRPSPSFHGHNKTLIYLWAYF